MFPNGTLHVHPALGAVSPSHEFHELQEPLETSVLSPPSWGEARPAAHAQRRELAGGRGGGGGEGEATCTFASVTWDFAGVF